MKKILVTILLLSVFAINSKAQDNVSLTMQYQRMMEKVISRIPEVANSTSNKIMDFAKSLLGTRYRYASSNPEIGFDCSGFVSYVYKQFGFSGARSSADFAKKGKAIKLADAKVGDILVFTGSNARVRRPGHVGIVYSKDADGNIKFIHSSSGKAKGVTITDLEGYYKNRFLKAVTVME
ncbi:C40 family peptidase [Pedobacter nanyangensis]|uniref:C40 family peptidase n=1 Tax=Pedobacter nanyangensis TaxID=1562389 RepID=UPI000DE28269|nr:C40 family peptidase [Pedobacter nanyangensis]